MKIPPPSVATDGDHTVDLQICHAQISKQQRLLDSIMDKDDPIIPRSHAIMPAFSPLSKSSSSTHRGAGPRVSITSTAAHAPRSSINTDTPNTWITRDAAERLLEDRAELAASLEAGSKLSIVASSSFAVTATIERLRHDKAHTVRAAFDMAALAVLRGIHRQQEQQQQDDAYEIVSPSQLPQVIRDWKELETLRNDSLERTHNNKDYSKRVSTTASSKTVSVKTPETNSVEESAVDVAAAAADDVKPDVASSKSNAAAAASTSAREGPKFTRNTPASSAAALDYRFTSSRGILCAAGNLHFDAMTPPFEGQEMDILNIPQNLSAGAAKNKASGSESSSGTAASQVNLGAVRVEAMTLGQRSISVMENAIRRSKLRYQYRKENALYDRPDDDREFLQLVNPFSWTEQASNNIVSDDDEIRTDEDDIIVPHRPREGSLTTAWTTKCLPRLLSVLEKGAGHAIYHDVDFTTRHGRIADLLRNLSKTSDNYGPHLIITVEPDVHSFAQEFYDVNKHLTLINSFSAQKMRVLTYQGNPKQRRKLRRHFAQVKGLPESPFHVAVTTYANFLADYLHFCQVPWEGVILDDGVSWMSAAQGDQNSAIATIWDNGIWSSNDQHAGLAGTTNNDWDFNLDVLPEAVTREAWIGLTARHRIMTSATMTVEQRQAADPAPVSGLLGFVAPHFAATVREEWDRSRITADSKSMDHFRQLVARSTVVHCSDDATSNMLELAILALTGKLNAASRRDPIIPEIVFDDAFVSAGKISFGRRSSLLWLGPMDRSWLRYELGKSELQHILDSMKISNKHGAFCEEITTASSTTSSGATGQVAGSYAFRLAVCCGRHFGSEQGLRQHINAQHAPPGTWLCRTCGADCMTSQARTHHERSCGQPSSGAISGEQGATVGATPTVGQGSSGSGVGKKKSNRSTQPSGGSDDKDPDGSFRVPGYRGVWVNKKGRHFIKVQGKAVTEQGNDKVLWFDESDDAAKAYDDFIRADADNSSLNPSLELNFNVDGTRKSFYDDVTPGTTSGLGGSAVSVVPALSIINIKDLPPHVKPLLRDPRQTSRTGGNSKRHVYAYRGVCRQARKGHDRWQSQISFMGVNHYLGTFDSEWDAAAVYSWAHLILYGEEATKQAQKEGEEAAAAYEQEQRDIAAGKIPEPQGKPKKPKKPATPKENAESFGMKSEQNMKEKSTDGSPKKRKNVTKETSTNNEKKTKTNTKACKLEKEAIGSTVAKGVTKANVLAPRFDDISDLDLIESASRKLLAARQLSYCVSADHDFVSTAAETLRPSVALASSPPFARGGALLVGLCPSSYGWDLQNFVSSNCGSSDMDCMTSMQMLAVEYDEDGMNENFCSTIQGSVTVLGRAHEATARAYHAIGLGVVPMGGTVGRIDCHVGGVPGSCSETAACITYVRHSHNTQTNTFMFSCLSNSDTVTLNGQQVTTDMGKLPLFHEDVISVGARVMAVVLETS